MTTKKRLQELAGLNELDPKTITGGNGAIALDILEALVEADFIPKANALPPDLTVDDHEAVRLVVEQLEAHGVK